MRSLIDDLLASGNHRAGMLAQACHARTVSADSFADIDPRLDSLRNANDPDEFNAIATQV